MRQLVHDYGERFAKEHFLALRFTDTAADALIAEALEKQLSVRDLCGQKFKDFQFGLKLIAGNTGRKEFTLDADAVAAPEKVLSEWVVASYRKEG